MHSVTITEAPTGPTAPDQGATPEQTQERPEWLPENFKTPEDLAAAYRELQSKFTQERQQKPAKVEAKESAKGGEGGQPDGAEEEVSVETFIMEALAEGELSEEHYAALEEAGYDRSQIDYYVKGVQAEAQAILDTAYEVAGGEQEYQKIIQWYAANSSAKTIEQFNKLVDNGDAAQITLAIKGIVADYRAANGQPAGRRLKGGGQVKGEGGFQSWAEVTKAMSDPRYSNDPAYRKSVEARLAASGQLL